MQWARQFDTGDVALANSLISHCLGRKLELAPGEVMLAACRLHQGEIPPHSIRIDFVSDAGNLTLWLEEAAANRLLGDVCWPAFDQDLAQLFVSEHVASVLNQLDNLLKTCFSVNSVIAGETTPESRNCIALRLQLNGGENLNGFIQFSADLRTRLANGLASIGTNGHDGKVSLSAQIFAGVQCLSQEDFARVEPGAVILLRDQNRQTPEENGSAKGPAKSLPVTVAIGEQMFFAATLSNSKIRVTSNQPARQVTESAYRMNNKTDKANDQAADQNKISLTFRLGTANLTIAELQSIAPGFVMSLFALYKANDAPSRQDIDDALAESLSA